LSVFGVLQFPATNRMHSEIWLLASSPFPLRNRNRFDHEPSHRFFAKERPQENAKLHRAQSQEFNDLRLSVHVYAHSFEIGEGPFQS
jgi:hypothetical protein